MITIPSDETVLLEVRRHWYALLLESLLILVLAFIPFVLLGVLGGFEALVNLKTLSFGVFLTAVWYLLLWMGFFVVWTNYYLDLWIVTDRRIIAVEQHHLFSREISEFRLERIQDVSIDVRGIIPTLLKFGDLHVQTAGEHRQFVIRQIPHPERVKDLIFGGQVKFTPEVNDPKRSKPN
ncbi:MAG: PH domain-containing protein [Candidatus Liptonbacteria bacterium]|nr:PH domain-containing protein [Candidatus Liptonbacteria bacterium]